MQQGDVTSVWVALISTTGGVLIAYIANVLAKKRRGGRPDRMENIFDGYEGLIKRQDEALNYKDNQLRENQKLLERMQRQLDEMSELVEKQRKEIRAEKELNRKLHHQLEEMRKQYGIDKRHSMGYTEKHK